MAQPSVNVMEFHIITENKPNEIPYDNQKVIPTINNRVKVKLISRALLSLNRRHTCGMNPPVVNRPPIKPRSSFQSKFTSYNWHHIFSHEIIFYISIIPPRLRIISWNNIWLDEQYSEMCSNIPMDWYPLNQENIYRIHEFHIKGVNTNQRLTLVKER